MIYRDFSEAERAFKRGEAPGRILNGLAGHKIETYSQAKFYVQMLLLTGKNDDLANIVGIAGENDRRRETILQAIQSTTENVLRGKKRVLIHNILKATEDDFALRHAVAIGVRNAISMTKNRGELIGELMEFPSNVLGREILKVLDNAAAVIAIKSAREDALKQRYSHALRV